MSSEQTTADPLAQVALTLHETAREHKRLSAYHRRRAREAMQDLELVRAVLAKKGIRFTVKGEEIGSHGHATQAD